MMSLLADEVLNPFYLFQVFSIILWFNDDYEKYACCILVISLFGICQSLHETVTNIEEVRRMAKYECQIQVRRRENNANQEFYTEQISSQHLVPGDIIIVPDNCTLPCDSILMSGSCVVSESMLTGESVPVLKQ